MSRPKGGEPTPLPKEVPFAMTDDRPAAPRLPASHDCEHPWPCDGHCGWWCHYFHAEAARPTPEPAPTPPDFEGESLLRNHTLPAMERAIERGENQIFSPKEMALIVAAFRAAPADPLSVEARRALWDSRRHEMNVDGSACWCAVEPMPHQDHEELCLRLRAVLARLGGYEG